MRNHLVCFLLAVAFLPLQAFSQASQMSASTPLPLQITTGKTTHLVFAYNIKMVDRGSSQILVQKAKGVENVLQLKAAQECFAETNLTVITADGKLFPFTVTYAEDPQNLTINITDSVRHASANFDSPFENLATIVETAGEVNVQDYNITPIEKDIDGIKLALSALYIKDNLLLLKADIRNSSGIAYDIADLRLLVADNKRAKRTAVQETQIPPLHIRGNTRHISAGSSAALVIAIPKLTIPDNKHLELQLTEQNGGRHLTLKVRSKHLMQAQKIR